MGGGGGGGEGVSHPIIGLSHQLPPGHRVEFSAPPSPWLPGPVIWAAHGVSPLRVLTRGRQGALTQRDPPPTHRHHPAPLKGSRASRHHLPPFSTTALQQRPPAAACLGLTNSSQRVPLEPPTHAPAVTLGARLEPGGDPLRDERQHGWSDRHVHQLARSC